MENKIQSSGHMYEKTLLKARYGASDLVTENMSGISALPENKKLLKLSDIPNDLIVRMMFEGMKRAMFSGDC